MLRRPTLRCTDPTVITIDFADERQIILDFAHGYATISNQHTHGLENTPQSVTLDLEQLRPLVALLAAQPAPR